MANSSSVLRVPKGPEDVPAHVLRRPPPRNQGDVTESSQNDGNVRFTTDTLQRNIAQQRGTPQL